ncbi:hypothetical protein D3C80_636130 [compost metagenome]
MVADGAVVPTEEGDGRFQQGVEAGAALARQLAQPLFGRLVHIQGAEGGRAEDGDQGGQDGVVVGRRLAQRLAEGVAAALMLGAFDAVALDLGDQGRVLLRGLIQGRDRGGVVGGDLWGCVQTLADHFVLGPVLRRPGGVAGVVHGLVEGGAQGLEALGVVLGMDDFQPPGVGATDLALVGRGGDGQFAPDGGSHSQVEPSNWSRICVSSARPCSISRGS